MGEAQNAKDKATAILELSKIARPLFHRLLQVPKEQHRARVLAHISGRLVLAHEASDGLDETFLDEVEALCTWPTWIKAQINFRGRYPTLNALVDQTLPRYDRARESAKNGLLLYSKATEAEQNKLQYFRMAKPFEIVNMDSQKGAEYEGDRAGEPKDPLEDCPDFVFKDFYKTLQKYSRCHCSHLPAITTQDAQHEARLRLYGRSSLSDGFAIFDMHYSGFPVLPPDHRVRHWKQLRLRIHSKRAGLKEAHFDTPPVILADSTDSAPKTQTDRHEHVTRPKFCELLGEDLGSVNKCLQIKGSLLFDIDEADSTDLMLERELSIPLTQVLDLYNLSTKMKLILAYTLARSMWLYYDSDWTSTSWTCESIQFMREIRRTKTQLSLITCRPFLMVRFRDRDDQVPEYRDLKGISHKYPRILALGTLLLNIGWGVHSQESQRETDTSVQKINDECTSGQQIKDDKNWPPFGHADEAGDELRRLYRDATSACFDARIFQSQRVCNSCRRKKTKCLPQGTGSCKNCLAAGQVCTYNSNPKQDKTSAGSEASVRRKLLFDRVLKPLCKAIYLVNWQASLDSPEAIPLKTVRKSPLTRQRDKMGLTESGSDPDRGRFFDDERMSKTDLDKKHPEYIEWKNEFLKVSDSFELPAPEKPPLRVKIAVLDTGLDKDHQDIQSELKRIWVYDSAGNDFKKAKTSEISDSIGHGTHVTGLILEYAPKANVYVADVTVDGKANRELIAKVIRSAVDSGVDIISISCGFQAQVLGDALESAVHYAYCNGVHIFAAASNNGGRTGRAWPARYNTVFCIHSTDANGNSSRFNPTRKDEEVNFATIGEAVESTWPTSCQPAEEEDDNATLDNADVPEEKPSVAIKCGTSFATPIAASVGAFLLRYARLYLEPEHAKQLKKHSKMKAVLQLMAGEKRDGFYFLSLEDNVDNFFSPKKQRSGINSAIITAMEQSG